MSDARGAPVTRRTAAAALLAAILGLDVSGCAGVPRLPLEIESAAASERFVVLVELRRQVDFESLDARHRREGLGRSEAGARALEAMRSISREGEEALASKVTGLRDAGEITSYRHLVHRNAAVVSATRRAIAELSKHRDVERIETPHESLAAPAGAASSAERPVPPGDAWPVATLELRSLWSQGIDGRGIVVASLDSGVFGAHASLAAGWRADRGWYEPDRTGAAVDGEPRDDAAHGTFVLSGAVGRPVDGRALGAAPGARWVATLANREGGYDSIRMALAADWLVDVARPDVVLAAWGHGPGSCVEIDRRMIDAMRATGILPLFAAGNHGPGAGSGQSPATLSGMFPDGRGPLSVGAVDRNGRVTPLSSRGPRGCGGSEPFPDLVAPGQDVPAARDVGNAALDDRLWVTSGTSIAVGWAGGIAALVMQVAPEMPVHEVEDLLTGTARDLDPPGLDDASGHGAIDAVRAVDEARRWQELRGREE